MTTKTEPKLVEELDQLTKLWRAAAETWLHRAENTTDAAQKQHHYGMCTAYSVCASALAGLLAKEN